MTTQPDKPVYFMPQFMVYNGFDSSASPVDAIWTCSRFAMTFLFFRQPMKC